MWRKWGGRAFDESNSLDPLSPCLVISPYIWFFYLWNHNCWHEVCVLVVTKKLVWYCTNMGAVSPFRWCSWVKMHERTGFLWCSHRIIPLLRIDPDHIMQNSKPFHHTKIPSRFCVADQKNATKTWPERSFWFELHAQNGTKLWWYLQNPPRKVCNTLKDVLLFFKN